MVVRKWGKREKESLWEYAKREMNHCQRMGKRRPFVFAECGKRDEWSSEHAERETNGRRKMPKERRMVVRKWGRRQVVRLQWRELIITRLLNV